MHRAAGQTLLPRSDGEASIERGVAPRVPVDGVRVSLLGALKVLLMRR